ncbi:MAG: flavin reductase family protein [Thermoplasmatota archaeon]
MIKTKDYHGLIAPRPTVCVSTLNPEGNSNIAPYSFVTPVAFEPPLIGISVGENKDTLLNARDIGDFVVVPLTRSWIEKGIHTEVELSRDKSEFDEIGLTEKESRKVRSPSVEEAPINIECEFYDELKVGDHILLVGKVIHIGASPSSIKNQRINLENLGAVGHIRGEEFSLTQEILQIERD